MYLSMQGQLDVPPGACYPIVVYYLVTGDCYYQPEDRCGVYMAVPGVYINV